MSGLSGIWAELGIEPTRDIRTIKKAYARQAAKYHPEEAPEKFQQVYHAYEVALGLAKKQKQLENEVHKGRPGDEPPLMSDDGRYYEDNRYSGADEQQETDGQQENLEAWSKLDEIFLTGEEENQWRVAEKINALTEKYAKEEEQRRIRSAFYDSFLVDIVLDKLGAFVNAGKIQSHEKWDSYLQDSLFLEAVHKEGFLYRFTNRIEKLHFLPKTIKMVKEALEREAYGELEEQRKLHKLLEEKVQSSQKEQMTKRTKRAGAVILSCLLILLVYRVGQNGKAQKELKELRSLENIEAYIEEKYQISADVSPSNLDGLYGEIPHSNKKDTEYFTVETLGSEGVPESFHLAWDTSSMDYEEIQDDLEYENVKMYAETFELPLDTLQPYANIIQIVNTPLEEFEPKFLNFLNALQKSRFVQDGNAVVIRVQPSFMYSDQVSITVEKGKDINTEEVSTKLKECTENSILYFNQQQ